jgi:hypothetical protein
VLDVILAAIAFVLLLAFAFLCGYVVGARAERDHSHPDS